MDNGQDNIPSMLRLEFIKIYKEEQNFTKVHPLDEYFPEGWKQTLMIRTGSSTGKSEYVRWIHLSRSAYVPRRVGVFAERDFEQWTLIGYIGGVVLLKACQKGTEFPRPDCPIVQLLLAISSYVSHSVKFSVLVLR